MASINKIYSGLEILSKHLGPDEDCEAQHDTFFVGGEKSADKIPPEDQEKLESLGWHIDSRFDCWTIFT